jgi:bifunctional DNA-binding transcriptional regulator/antitoxin component of YhaV-PrlF toxin-antitoxin module
METTLLRAVDGEGHVIISSRFQHQTGIPRNRKVKLYLQYQNEVVYVWNPDFCDFALPNSDGLLIIETDKYNRFTIPKEIRDDMGILPSDQINCACYGGVLHFWAVKKPVCRLCKSPLGETLQGLRLCLNCIREVQALDPKITERNHP